MVRIVTKYDKGMTYSTSHSYKKHINFKVGQLQYIHKPQSIAYKVDQFVTGTSSSSHVVNFNIRFLFYLNTLRLKL